MKSVILVATTFILATTACGAASENAERQAEDSDALTLPTFNSCVTRVITQPQITCGKVVLTWKAQHTKLVNALIAAGIPIDRSTLVAGTSVSLAGSQVAKDARYRVRGVLEEINANSTSLEKLKTVINNLSASGMPALPQLLPDPGSDPCEFPQPTESGRAANIRMFKGSGTYAVSSICETPPVKSLLPFAEVGNEYLAVNPGDASVQNNNYNTVQNSNSSTVQGSQFKIEFRVDPQSSPDGFGSYTSSGSCSTYGPEAISTNASDARFYNGGSCDPNLGAGCASCNLTGESGCGSRIVWRRVGASSAWRCRSL